ncbi:IS3 family transposase [Staphylococcus sp. 2S1]
MKTLEGIFMSKTYKVNTETFLLAFRMMENGVSASSVIKELNINLSKSMLNEKYSNFKINGIKSIMPSLKNNTYSKHFKRNVVEEYFNTELSSYDLAYKYNIPSSGTVRSWIKRYTEGIENKTYSPKSEVYTMKARKTTLNERIEIVEYYIANEMNYKATAEKFNVTYGQLYNWVKKYKEHGSDGLIDSRGKHKPKSIMTDEEVLKAEIKALKERNKYLQMENEVLKKEEIIEREDESKIRQQASYKTIEALKYKYPILKLCEILGVSRSGYYKWLHRTVSKLEQENLDLMDTIQTIYDKYKGIYGYRRIYIYIRLKLGKTVNHKRIYRLMNKMNLKATIRKKKKRYIKSKPTVTAENILNRQFNESRPNTKWLTDTTEFKTKTGQKVYLSAIYDLGSKKIISYEMNTTNNNEYVFNTLRKAINQVDNTQGIVFHSDRGFQYTNSRFKKILDENKMIQSMSRVSRCIDNGPMEGVWGIIKSEIYKGNKNYTFETVKLAKKVISEYINFFNNDRITLKMADRIPKGMKSA